MYRALAWSLIVFACFYGIGSYPLLDNNEGIYASIARDMLSSGQFVVPHLNGGPYLEKPPMLYWLLAFSMSIFGVNTWAARLVPAAALFITACLMQRFIYRNTRSETASFAAPLIFVTSLPLLGIGRMIFCDMVLTCFLSAALMQFYDWQVNARKRSLLGFYVLIGCAVLTKGLVSIILAGGTIFVFSLWQKKLLRHYVQLISPIGILLFLAIVVPWHVAASMQQTGFAWFYFVNEHLLRFLNRREPHDYYTGPPWYYLPRIAAYLLPWTPFLALPLRHPLATAPSQPVLTKFLWSWFLFCLFFFSVSGAKANYYMITGMPALVMLIALQLETANVRILRWLASGSFALIITGLWVTRLFCSEISGELYSTCEAVSSPIIDGTALYAALGFVLCWRIALRLLIPMVATYILLAAPLLISGMNVTGDRASQKAVADYLAASSYDKIAVYQEFEELSSLAFYMQKPLVIVDSLSSDLLYGQKQSPNTPGFESAEAWTAHKPHLPMILLKQRIDLFMAKMIRLNVDIKHICVLKRFDRVALVGDCPK